MWDDIPRIVNDAGGSGCDKTDEDICSVAIGDAAILGVGEGLGVGVEVAVDDADEGMLDLGAWLCCSTDDDASIDADSSIDIDTSIDCDASTDDDKSIDADSSIDDETSMLELVGVIELSSRLSLASTATEEMDPVYSKFS